MVCTHEALTSNPNRYKRAGLHLRPRNERSSRTFSLRYAVRIGSFRMFLGIHREELSSLRATDA